MPHHVTEGEDTGQKGAMLPEARPAARQPGAAALSPPTLTARVTRASSGLASEEAERRPPPVTVPRSHGTSQGTDDDSGAPCYLRRVEPAVVLKSKLERSCRSAAQIFSPGSPGHVFLRRSCSGHKFHEPYFSQNLVLILWPS